MKLQLCTVDIESFWSETHTLKKMSPLEYVMHQETELQMMTIKVDHWPTDVFVGEDEIRHVCSKLDWSNKFVIAHNGSAFDHMILAWRLGIRPAMWGCTLAMARPVHAKTTGLSLGKLVEHYGLGVKNNSALIQTRGRKLADFTPSELAAMKQYNRDDTDQCYELFQRLKVHFNAKELWHIDATIRRMIDPKFELDVPMLETALSMERSNKHKALLDLAKQLKNDGMVLDWGDEAAITEWVRAELSSTPKFKKLLEDLGVPVPMKRSPSNPLIQVPALAKTDEAFIKLTEDPDETVAAAARARLAVKSTILETRIEKFLMAARVCDGKLPITTHYCGADTTGRDSGFEYNPLNLPRVNKKKPKLTDALRRCLKAPKGQAIAVADSSGIELRTNHFLWKVPSSMEMYQANVLADLYRAFAAVRYGVTPEEIDDGQRQVGKIAQLGLGFGAGGPTFQKIARIQGGLKMELDEAYEVVRDWRSMYDAIVLGWRRCAEALPYIRDGVERDIDDWGLATTCAEGIRLNSSGRLIRYPNLRQELFTRVLPDGTEKTEKVWMYAEGRHRAFLTGPKVCENVVQALARDALFDWSLQIFKQTGHRSVLQPYDEWVGIDDERQAPALLDEVQGIMRTPPKWWPELIVWSEGGVGARYGDAKS